MVKIKCKSSQNKVSQTRKQKILTVRFGGDPQGGGALSWSHVIVGDNPEAVALLWFQVWNRQLQRLRFWHVHWPFPDTEKHTAH